MLHSDEGFILNRKAYGDTGFILNIFTRSHGKRAFFIQGVRKKKKGSAALFQAFNLIQFTHYDGKGSLLRMKDPQVHPQLVQLYDSPPRAFILQFLAELFSEILHDQEEHTVLFDACKHQLITELKEEKFNPNLHLQLFCKLLFSLGISPQLPDVINGKCFNLIEGEFQTRLSDSHILMSGENSRYFYQFLKESQLDEIDGKHRLSLVNDLLKYLDAQCEWFRGTKSQNVLGEIL